MSDSLAPVPDNPLLAAARARYTEAAARRDAFQPDPQLARHRAELRDVEARLAAAAERGDAAAVADLMGQAEALRVVIIPPAARRDAARLAALKEACDSAARAVESQVQHAGSAARAAARQRETLRTTLTALRQEKARSEGTVYATSVQERINSVEAELKRLEPPAPPVY